MLRLPAAACALLVGVLVSSVLARQAQTPVFRGGAVLVPIDVRVLDRNGRSITDLKASDLTVFEDGVRQEISHFSPQALMPQAAGRAATPRQSSFGPEIASQSRRVFLFVLGRGRLQQPSMGVDAVLRFVRELLLPQDQVAVLAWDRATDFTTDHDRIAQVIERFKRRHETIEQMLKDRFSGLAAVYGSKQLPASIQREIDAVFRGPENAGLREVPPGPVANAERMDTDSRRTADLLMGTPKADALAAANADAMSSSFDDFVSASRQTMQDLGNLYTGIEYLRRLEGEKHLVFVTERGITLPRLEDDRSLAAMASDARVAIDTIQTGGLSSPTLPASARGGTPTPAPALTLRDSLAAMTLKNIAELTGGQVSVYEPARGAIESINGVTRFGYLIGYSPSNREWNGRYRRITIKVNRPDVTVLYRHGYYGQPALTSFDHRQLVTSSRMNAAASYREDIRDIKIDAKASSIRVGTTTAQVFVEVTIDASRLKFSETPGDRVGEIAIAFACFGASQKVVGQSGFEVSLPYDETAYRQILKDGIRYNATIAVTGATSTVKVIVYDFAADLIGTVVARVR